MKSEKISCYLCGIDKETFLFMGRDWSFRLKEQFRVVRCDNCGLIYINPRPAFESLGKFYPPEYRSFQKRQINNGLRSRLWGPIERRRIAEIEKFHSLDNQDIRLLDIGCGAGSFLHSLKMGKECQGIGIEMGKEVSNFCQKQLNLDVRVGTLFDNEFQDKYFDVVTMWHYFEHELDPLTILKTVKRILKEGGLLVMEVPNIDSFTARLFKSRWSSLDVPRHIIQYTPETIRHMLEKTGFKLEAIKYVPSDSLVAGTSILRLLSIPAFRSSSRDFGEIWKFPIRAIVLFLSLITFPLSFLLSALKTSDIIRVYGRPVKDREAV